MGRPKRRRLGQNFLVDARVARRIADQLRPEPPRVLEIGPGRGALTEPLLDRFDRVLALELDGNLVPPLSARFGDRGCEVRHADALGEDLDPHGRNVEVEAQLSGANRHAEQVSTSSLVVLRVPADPQATPTIVRRAKCR